MKIFNFSFFAFAGIFWHWIGRHQVPRIFHVFRVSGNSHSTIQYFHFDGIRKSTPKIISHLESSHCHTLQKLNKWIFMLKWFTVAYIGAGTHPRVKCVQRFTCSLEWKWTSFHTFLMKYLCVSACAVRCGNCVHFETACRFVSSGFYSISVPVKGRRYV